MSGNGLGSGDPDGASPRDLILLALPWQRYDTTAVQLGALQAWLTDAGFAVDTRHYYRDLIAYLDPGTYLRVFEAYMGESAFAALMFPERYESIKRAVASCVDFDLSLPGTGVLRHPQINANLSLAEREQLAQSAVQAPMPTELDFDGLVATLERFLDDVYTAVEWDRYRVIGFTTSHQQLIPTVLLARRLKQRVPDTPIVVGGALMTRGLPATILKLFECFDVVIEGEGELALTDLLGTLTGREPGRTLADVKGAVWRGGEGEIVRNDPPPAIEDLDKLPVPDYDDYFRHVLRPEALEVIPKLAVEGSRACIWGRCTYCNLNLQWSGLYRRKSHRRVAEEISLLRKRYQSPFFTLCDTNVEDKMPLFELLADDPYDYRILAEVSPNIDRAGVRALRRAGVRTIQAGIESFSDRILRLYHRNHRVMRSLELLKWASEFDVELYYNVIINFPAETESDVAACVSVVDYARYFMYPSVHDYSFTVDSPAWEDMATYNIAGWYLPDEVADCYPEPYRTELAQLLALTIKPTPATETSVDWSPFLAAVDRWKHTFHANLGRPGLVYFDAGDFLTVTIRGDQRGSDAVMVLPGDYRSIYLACIDASRTLDEIAQSVPHLEEAAILGVLSEMFELKILFAERNRYLALAIRESNVGNFPEHERTAHASAALMSHVEDPDARQRRISRW